MSSNRAPPRPVSYTHLDVYKRQVVDTGAKAAEADIFNHPALGGTLFAQARDVTGERGETVIKPLQHGNTCLDRMAGVLALRGLRSPIQGQMAEYRPQHRGRVFSPQIQIGRYVTCLVYTSRCV